MSRTIGYRSILVPVADNVETDTALDVACRLATEHGASITALATGDKASLHDTMIAMEQADVSFRLMMQVRNKIVEAYQEILRMQV